MCACSATFTCSRCRGTRLAADYLDPGNDVLGFDPYEQEPVSPAEYEVVDA